MGEILKFEKPKNKLFYHFVCACKNSSFVLHFGIECKSLFLQCEHCDKRIDLEFAKEVLTKEDD